MVVPEAGDGRWCQAQRCSAIFSVLSCRSLRDLYFVLYDMNETRITMQKKEEEKTDIIIMAGKTTQLRFHLYLVQQNRRVRPATSCL